MSSTDPQPTAPQPPERGARKKVEPAMTVGDLLDSDLVGMWKDREDIGDSVEFARKLRERAWRGERSE